MLEKFNWALLSPQYEVFEYRSPFKKSYWSLLKFTCTQDLNKTNIAVQMWAERAETSRHAAHFKTDTFALFIKYTAYSRLVNNNA